MNFSIAIAIVVSLLSIAYAFYLSKKIGDEPVGQGKMVDIARYIKEGAVAFLKRQYMSIGGIAILLALILYLVYGFTGNWLHGFQVSTAFIFGAALSMLSGYIGMWSAGRSNIRTAHAAQNSLSRALVIALRGGAVSGISIVAMSLLGISGLFLIYGYFGYNIAADDVM